MSAYNDMDQALAGLINGFENSIETGISGESIAFGSPVFGHEGVEDTVYGPHLDQSTLTLDADLITANVYTVTVNDVVVAETFATSHAVTMAALIVSLNAAAGIVALGISAVEGGSDKAIVFTGPGLDITATGVVTLGSTQAGATAAVTTYATFMGVAVFKQTSTVAGDSGYVVGDAVNIMSEGALFVPVSTTVLDKQAAYAILAVTDRGEFSNSSSATYDVGCFFRSNSSNDLAILEVRGLK